MPAEVNLYVRHVSSCLAGYNIRLHSAMEVRMFSLPAVKTREHGSWLFEKIKRKCQKGTLQNIICLRHEMWRLNGLEGRLLNLKCRTNLAVLCSSDPSSHTSSLNKSCCKKNVVVYHIISYHIISLYTLGF